MPKLNNPTDISDALSAPLGDLIAAVGRGVADAQQALDEGTIETLKKLYAENNELLKFGYQPTWYKIPEVDAEISVSLSISGSAQESTGVSDANTASSGIKLYAAPIDANYSKVGS